MFWYYWLLLAFLAGSIIAFLVVVGVPWPRRPWGISWKILLYGAVALVILVLIFSFIGGLPKTPSKGEIWEWVADGLGWAGWFFTILLIALAVGSVVAIFTFSGWLRIGAVMALVFLLVLMLPVLGTQIHNISLSNWWNAPLDFQTVKLDDKLRIINPSDNQVRVDVQSAGCILLYNKVGRYLGKSCAGDDNILNGKGYSAKTEDGRVKVVDVTICPRGSSGTNSGSCN